MPVGPNGEPFIGVLENGVSRLPFAQEIDFVGATVSRDPIKADRAVATITRFISAPIAWTGQVDNGQLPAFAGNEFVANAASKIHKIIGSLKPNGGTFKAIIARTNGVAGVIQELFETPTKIIAGATRQSVEFVFDVPVDIAAGETYVILIGRTDGGNNPTPLLQTSSAGNPESYTIPGETTAVFITLAQAAPAIGQAVTRTVSPFKFTQLVLFSTE